MIYVWELEDALKDCEIIENYPDDPRGASCLILGTGGDCMNRTYHKCHFCGGDVVEKRITADYRWGEELIALIENVPTGVCQVCGEQYLKAEIVKEIERVVHSRENPKKLIQVPLRELAVA